MSTIEIYRANAADQLAAARATNLLNRRAMHERAAETWETMAAALEETAARAALNQAAKAGVKG